MKKPQKKARTGHYRHNVRLAQKPSKIKRKRKVRNLPPYLTVPEKNRFFKAIESARDRAIFRLLYHHGLRASEIGKLQLSDYRPGSSMDLDRILIHRLKGSISGECGVVPAAALAIQGPGYAGGALSPAASSLPGWARRSTRRTLFDLMRRYCERAQIPLEKAHPHCLKHTCCTHLISDQGESIMDVQTPCGPCEHPGVR